MRFTVILALILHALFSVDAQIVSTQPALPSPAQPVTITFDVSGTDFAAKNLSDVWLWAWLENGTNDINAPTNVNPATAAQDGAKVIRSSTNPNLYSITLTATTFFNKPAAEIQTVGVLLKGRDWSNGQTADKFITFSEIFAVTFVSPRSSVFFINESGSIDISVSTNQPAAIVLKTGTATIASSSGPVTEFSYSHLVTESEGSVTVTAEADNGSEIATTSFTYVIRTPTVQESRPGGVVDGINYFADASTVALSLWAPGKSSVYVLGDFNGWRINPEFQMKQDGEHFWLQITGLTPGTEYAFQYLVDESLKIADPYADKILDPDDAYIPETSYPDLKPFPSAALSDEWYFNRLAVLQTAQQDYEWTVTDFQKPAKQNLVIYELLIRDFFDGGERTFQNLIDTLTYFKRLGINAIELMPVMEFNGNESWGYNPTFLFAVDKYYGTQTNFKEFIDKCHQNGIAVILDIAMNHHDIPNPYVMMDFDFVNGKPEADNRWFNVNATHPFNVFFDMNHESPYTQKYLDTVTYYWLHEYKVDGFRFDLSKGFTQKSNPTNVGAWSSYDQSRISILKRMADQIWQHSPDAFVILEHFADNAEEKELAEYRAAEGQGMLLWGKMTEPYNQLTMGYSENSDISAVQHTSRGWSVPHLVGYMESHDEERLMVKNLWYGKETTSYSVKDTLTALYRMRAASTLFYTLPGPKMLWQFGEFGYDLSINHCSDGTNNESCRVSAKPVRWDYGERAQRRWLFEHIRDLIRLRKEYDVFTVGTATFSSANSLVKQVILKNSPYTSTPLNAGEMNAVIIANFDVVERNVSVDFPHTGSWYSYYDNADALNISGSATAMALPAGSYKLFTDIPLESNILTSVIEHRKSGLVLYPNPAHDVLTISAGERAITEVKAFSQTGICFPLKKAYNSMWDISTLPSGFFIVEIRTMSDLYRVKIVKK